MSHFQSYSYVSSNVNGKQNELFLHQTKNEKENKKNFVAKKSEQGKNIKTLRGKSRNDEKWTIQQEGQKASIDRPFQDFENWFPQNFGIDNFLQHPLLPHQSLMLQNLAQLPQFPHLPQLAQQQPSQSKNAMITYSTPNIPSYNPFDHDFFKN